MTLQPHPPDLAAPPLTADTHRRPAAAYAALLRANDAVVAGFSSWWHEVALEGSPGREELYEPEETTLRLLGSAVRPERWRRLGAAGLGPLAWGRWFGAISLRCCCGCII